MMSPKMQPQGSDNPVIYFLDGHPTAKQDEQNDYFSGDSGEYFVNRIPKEWDDRIRANWTVRCHPSKEKDIDEVTVICCENSVLSDIDRVKPKIIVGMGWEPLRWVLKETRIDIWRSRFVPVKIRDTVYWYYAMLSPAIVLSKRRMNKKTKKRTTKTEWDTQFELDLQNLFDTLDKNLLPEPKVYDKDIQKGIMWTEGNQSDKELEKVLGWLKEAESWGEHANDIETTAIRPYKEDARILTISVGTFDKTYAFPYDYRGSSGVPWTQKQLSRLRKGIKEYLVNSGKKICHNVKFEQEWFSYFFGNECLRETEWGDTQAEAYTLDERRGLHSLDKLCVLYFGLNLKDLSNLDRKRMESYPLKRILPYNGLDVKWTFKLHEALEDKLRKDRTLIPVVKHLIRTSPTLVMSQQQGLDVDVEYKDGLIDKAAKEIADIVQRFRDQPDVIAYRDKFGRALQISSPDDVLKFFKNFKGLDDELKTKHDKYSTDAPILKALKDPVADLILEYRGVAKKKSTYLDSIADLIYPDGKLHTNFNAYVTSTGRLSSDDPNMQNWPNAKGREIRRMIVPPENHWIVCSDYGQIEARLLGVASQDKNFCEVLWNDYDVHMEWAEKIINKSPDILDRPEYRELSRKEVVPKFRKLVKNQWVFPAFYGSSPYSIAASIGVSNDKVFELFKEFWDTFSGVRKWQGWIKDYYNKHGYVETLTGRRRHGPLSFNEAVNAPIQGTASDICVDAMNRLSEYGYKTVLNVHDDVTSVVHDDDLDEAILHIPELMCEVPFDWINVPIAVEVTAGPNWEQQEEIGTFKSTDYHEVPRGLEKLGHYQQYL